MTHHASRTQSRRLVRLAFGILAAGAVFGAAAAPAALAQTSSAQAQAGTALSQPTVGQTTSVQALTLAETEGPYYKTNSPETSSLVQPGLLGTVLTLTGQVLDQSGQPVANALLDFWQADAGGAYDNTGYTLRGQQYTAANGFYTVTTVVPGLYPGRTRHIHVKVQAPNSSVLTTQLFFPGEASNSRDSIFDRSLLLNIADNADGSQNATFNFVVATA